MQSMNFTKEDQHDLWINDPAWGVICLLKCKQPVNFLFIWWKPQGFFWNLTHKERGLKFSNLCTWGDLWGVIMRCEKSECEPGIRIPPLLPSWYRNTGKMRFHRLSQPDLSTSYWWDLNCAKVPPVHPQTILTKVKLIWISVGGWMDCSLTNKLVLNEANKYKKKSLSLDIEWEGITHIFN